MKRLHLQFSDPGQVKGDRRLHQERTVRLWAEDYWGVLDVLSLGFLVLGVRRPLSDSPLGSAVG